MINEAVHYFVSFFQNPSTSGILAISIGLAIGFGVVWLAGYRPPLFKKPWLWAVLAGSPFLTLAAASFILFPLLNWTGLYPNPSTGVLVAGIPIVLLSGLVHEGANMVPVVVYWRRSGKNIDPKLGLAIGAVAGAGFGIFGARLALNFLFILGVTWQTIQAGGFVALPGFWEEFFYVAAHIAFSALAGYGLAKGRGWQFYLIASGLHALLNYGKISLVVLLPDLHEEIYVAVIAVAVTAWALWLRWRKRAATIEPETSSQ